LCSFRADVDRLEKLLGRALRPRNSPVHDYFPDGAAAFLTENAKEHTIAELNKATVFATNSGSHAEGVVT
jgi:hypothetical protein